MEIINYEGSSKDDDDDNGKFDLDNTVIPKTHGKSGIKNLYENKGKDSEIL